MTIRGWTPPGMSLLPAMVMDAPDPGSDRPPTLSLMERQDRRPLCELTLTELAERLVADKARLAELEAAIVEDRLRQVNDRTAAGKRRRQEVKDLGYSIQSLEHEIEMRTSRPLPTGPSYDPGSR